VDKVVKILMGSKIPGSKEFIITVGGLLSSVKNPDGYQKRALLFFNKWFVE